MKLNKITIDYIRKLVNEEAKAKKKRKEMKPKPCKLICNNRWGYCATPMEFPSIRKAVEYGRNSTWFAFRVIVDGKVVRRGFGDND